MSPETLFALVSALVLPGWLALATAPFWRARAVLVARLVAALLCGSYFAMLVTGLAGDGPPEGAGFDTLAGVRLLLSTPEALLAGWVHYLAFDLFVGAWEVEYAPTAGVPHAVVLPCLIFTFTAGPVGLLLYLLAAAVTKARRRAIDTP